MRGRDVGLRCRFPDEVADQDAPDTGFMVARRFIWFQDLRSRLACGKLACSSRFSLLLYRMRLQPSEVCDMTLDSPVC